MRYPKYLFLLLLLGIIYIACEKTDDSVLDPTLNFPRIDTVSVTPNTIDSDTLNPIITAKVTSEEQVESVTAKVINPDNLELATYNLLDDGISPDISAGDGIYSARVDILLSCRLIGAYRIEFVARNVSGTTSPGFPGNFIVTRSGNTPPNISNLLLADSIQRPTTGLNTTTISMFAVDPNGYCDMLEVYFKSTRPDGLPGNGGNPIFMFDDGNIPEHGDTVATDTKYSVIVRIDPNAQLGYFKFRFNAKDRTGDTTNFILDSIYVYP